VPYLLDRVDLAGPGDLQLEIEDALLPLCQPAERGPIANSTGNISTGKPII
jgi:hypothetical protein